MNAFFWLIIYVCVNVVCIALCWHYSTVRKWKKIIGSACLIPFIYVVTSSLVPNSDFADPLVFITIPIMWVGISFFFYNKPIVEFIICVGLTIIELYLNTLCCEVQHAEEEQQYNEYRLEKYKKSEEYREQYDKYHDNLKKHYREL